MYVDTGDAVGGGVEHDAREALTVDDLNGEEQAADKSYMRYISVTHLLHQLARSSR
jgi:hypothetical protein